MGTHAVVAPGVLRVTHAAGYVNSFVLLEPDGSVTLVDCGLSRGARRITACLASVGRSPADVQRIVLTHAHPDHAGSAARMLAVSSAAGVAAHDLDRRDLESGSWELPAGVSLAGRVLQRLASGRFEPVAVARSLADGELLDPDSTDGHGMRAIHTPGHTAGHMSLLLEHSSVLLTGDAIMNPLGSMRWPLKAFCVSPEQNRASAALLANLDYATVAFAHGPEIRSRARESIAGFVSRAN